MSAEHHGNKCELKCNFILVSSLLVYAKGYATIEDFDVQLYFINKCTVCYLNDDPHSRQAVSAWCARGRDQMMEQRNRFKR